MGSIKRVAACAVVAAGVAAAPAHAMVAPACDVRLVAPVAPTASCGFAENSGWALITAEPVASTVTVTIRCFTSYGVVTSSRTVSDKTTWTARTPGTCNLELSSDSPTAVANATASPWYPIYTEPV
jgi:hypothetical protein